MASKHKYNTIEAGSLGLGSAGAKVSTGGALTGKFCAITAIADATFTTLTPEDDAHISSIPGGTLPAGVTIFGRWTAITPATGAIIAYNG